MSLPSPRTTMVVTLWIGKCAELSFTWPCQHWQMRNHSCREGCCGRVSYECSCHASMLVPLLLELESWLHCGASYLPRKCLAPTSRTLSPMIDITHSHGAIRSQLYIRIKKMVRGECIEFSQALITATLCTEYVFCTALPMWRQ